LNIWGFGVLGSNTELNEEHQLTIACPTDKLHRYNERGDAYRKSQQYAEDIKTVIAFLKQKYAFREFLCFWP
jgi:hypothetical protein